MRIVRWTFIVVIFYAFVMPLRAEAALAVGASQQFFVNDEYDWNGRTQIAATLRSSGLSAYFFVEDEYFSALSVAEQNQFLNGLAALSQEFDAVIYPKLTELFGDVRNPGIDGETRVFILATRLRPDAGGYVNTADEYPKSATVDGQPNISSNEKELIYLNAVHLTSKNINAYLAHELQHLISFNQKEWTRNMEEEVWLNEVRSEYAPAYLGYETPYAGSVLSNRVAAYQTDPSDSLTAWVGAATDYAAVNLFAQYLSGRFGSSLFQKMLAIEQTGIASVEQSLSLLGYASLSFRQLVLEWAIANAINDTALAEGRFSYGNPDLAAFKIINPTASFTLSQNAAPAAGNVSVEDWSAAWIDIVPLAQAPLQFAFSSTDENASLTGAVILTFTDGTHEIQDVAVSQNAAQFVVERRSSKTLEEATLVLVNGFQQGDFSETALVAPVSYSAQLVSGDTPVILSLSASSGFVERAKEVVVSGSGFTAQTKVFFGSTEAAVTFVNSTALRVVTPTGIAEGTQCLYVQNGILRSLCGDFRFYRMRSAGTLLRAQNDIRVWITNGSWKRHIMRPEIFSFYPHLGWAAVVSVPQEEAELYRESFLVRADGDSRVYEINGDLSKHWLNMSSEAFMRSGRMWDGVSLINLRERDFYAAGADVLSL